MDGWYPPTPTPRPIGALPEEYQLDFNSGFELGETANEAIHTWNMMQSQALFQGIMWLTLVILLVFGVWTIIKHVQYMRSS